MRNLLMSLMVIILVSCECHHETFRIDNVSMQPIVFTDSLANGKQYFVIDFITSWSAPKLVLFGGGIEPGLKGIDEEIKSIEVRTRSGRLISSCFKGWKTDMDGLISGQEESHGYYSSLNIASLVRSINNGERQSIGMRIGIPRLFYLSSSDEPYTITIKFRDRQITSKVIQMKMIYRADQPLSDLP